jgi:hypothetical protein
MIELDEEIAAVGNPWLMGMQYGLQIEFVSLS